MQKLGCTGCHVEKLVIEHDRRVADVDTRFDPEHGIFNRLFATATPLFTALDDGTGLPARLVPNGRSFVVEGFYSDLKRHDLGPTDSE